MKKTSNRLKKIALMPPEMFESTLDQISDKGREILKSIEEYKFFIDQTLRLVKNDPALGGVIQTKKKNLDHAAQDLYSIVFEIENLDISAIYEEQEQKMEEQQNGDLNQPPTPGNDMNNDGPKPPASLTPPAPGGNMAPTPPGAPASKPPMPPAGPPSHPPMPPKPPVKDDKPEDDIEEDKDDKEDKKPKDDKNSKDDKEEKDDKKDKSKLNPKKKDKDKEEE